MRELMLTLLTYEPFEEFTQAYSDERAYIDAVLSGQDGDLAPELQKYHELFSGFCAYDKNRLNGVQKALGWLKAWKDRYYPAQNYLDGETRELYPILFKKICFFIIVNEDNLSDKEFAGMVGLRENIFNKWKISTRYRKTADKDTSITAGLQRNGIKRSYITRVVKQLYYEAKRQRSEFMLSLGLRVHPYVFVDVFAGTGSVSASMDLPGEQLALNDADIGAACFLYSVSTDIRELQKRVAYLHNNFVQFDLSTDELYTVEEYREKYWKGFLKKSQADRKWNDLFDLDQDASAASYADIDIAKNADVDFYFLPAPDEDFLVRVRNNYLHMKELLQQAQDSDFDFDGLDPEFIYDIGAAWYFDNAIKESSYTANKQTRQKINVENYGDYLKRLGIVIPEGSLSARSIVDRVLKPSEIKPDWGEFAKRLHHAKVSCEDFRKVITDNPEAFLYLDSPYFLTTDYNIAFRDKDHADMLNLLKKTPAEWVFSMQLYQAVTNRAKSKRSTPKISDYGDYYWGFVNELTLSSEEDEYYTVSKELSPKADSLYVILFREAKTSEIMVCNFDARRAIPYCPKGTLILPYRRFINIVMASNISYEDLRVAARDWREDEIKSKYASGSIV